MKNQRVLKAIYGAAIVFLVLYAVAVLIYLSVVHGAGAATSNLFALGLVCAAFCGVTVLSYFMTKHSQIRKLSERETEMEESAPAEDKTPGKRVKGIAFMVFGVCLAISAFLVVWAVTGLGVSAGLKELSGGGYVKTRATVVQAVQDGKELDKLIYEYTAEDGVTYRSLGEASFGGIEFKAGKQVTLYYSAENPRVTASLSVPVFLLLGAFLFLVGGVAAAVLSVGAKKRNNAGGYILFTFFLLFGIGFYVAGGLASGLNVLELSLSGAGYYGITVFMLLGGSLDLLGLVGYIKKRIAGGSEQANESADGVRKL